MKAQPFICRFLVSQNHERDAKAALQWLRGPSADISRELCDMETANMMLQKDKLKFSEVMQACYVKPLSISVGLMFFQQVRTYGYVLFFVRFL